MTKCRLLECNHLLTSDQIKEGYKFCSQKCAVINTGRSRKGHPSWNKGLKRENDLRVAKYTKSMTETKRKQGKITTKHLEGYWKGRKQSKSSNEKRSRRMKIVRLNPQDHPNWKGGISCEPYCDAWADKGYKESIKERDNYVCQNPDCWKTAKRIGIHHIDYNKKHCEPWNLITLCASCNARANYNRSYWEYVYRSIIVLKYQNVANDL